MRGEFTYGSYSLLDALNGEAYLRELNVSTTAGAKEIQLYPETS